MSGEKRRGGWSNPASAANGAKSTDSPANGRPPQSVTLRLGQQLVLQERSADGFAPLMAGTVREIRRGVPREVTIEMADGTVYRLMV